MWCLPNYLEATKENLSKSGEMIRGNRIGILSVAKDKSLESELVKGYAWVLQVILQGLRNLEVYRGEQVQGETPSLKR